MSAKGKVSFAIRNSSKACKSRRIGLATASPTSDLGRKRSFRSLPRSVSVRSVVLLVRDRLVLWLRYSRKSRECSRKIFELQVVQETLEAPMLWRQRLTLIFLWLSVLA